MPCSSVGTIDPRINSGSLFQSLRRLQRIAYRWSNARLVPDSSSGHVDLDPSHPSQSALQKTADWLNPCWRTQSACRPGTGAQPARYILQRSVLFQASLRPLVLRLLPGRCCGSLWSRSPTSTLDCRPQNGTASELTDVPTLLCERSSRRLKSIEVMVASGSSSVSPCEGWATHLQPALVVSAY